MNLKTTLALLILAAACAVLFVYGLALPPALNPLPAPEPVASAGTREFLEKLAPDKLERLEIHSANRSTVLERTQGGVDAFVRQRLHAQGLKPGPEADQAEFLRRVALDLTGLPPTGRPPTPAEIEAFVQDKPLDGGKALGGWSLPGQWPTRTAEVNALVERVAGLRSRFDPIPITKPEQWIEYGLAKPALEVHLKLAGESHKLFLGEASDGDRFARPTYLRLDDKPEVVRLSPGLIALLDRPTDYYQQRRLFPGERVAREGNALEKVERLAARKGSAIHIEEPGKKIDETVAYNGSDWLLTKPSEDRLDPRARDALLGAVPELWAEQFITTEPAAVALVVGSAPDNLPAFLTQLAWSSLTTPERARSWLLLKSGLDKPEQTLTYTGANGATVTLLIGKVSGSRSRIVMREPPPGVPPQMRQPQPQIIQEEFRYAKLQNNPQIFEIKADGLKDVFVALDTLRDPQLARFNQSDVEKVEIVQGPITIELAREKDRWKLLKPLQADGDSAKIDELLTKLSSLEARGEDVSYPADLKSAGLDAPAFTIKATVKEDVKDKDKGDEPSKEEKKTRVLTWLLGKKDEAGKLAVKMADLPRVSKVDAGLLALTEREPLTYRGKRLLDFLAVNLEKMAITNPAGPVTLERKEGQWKLAAPVTADADSTKAEELAGSLSNLETLQYVSENPSMEDLEKKYGLTMPALSVALSFTDKTKPARTLLIGKERGGDQPGYFAKFADAPGVFAVGKEIQTNLGRPALAYRSRRLLDAQLADLASVTVLHGDQKLTLNQEAGAWKLTAPFQADVDSTKVQDVVRSLAPLETKEYVTLSAPMEDLEVKYGLGKPEVTFTVSLADKTKPARTFQVGKARSGKGGYYARQADDSAVFILDAGVHEALKRDSLSLLPAQLWQTTPEEIATVKIHKKGQPEYRLSRKDAGWQIAGPFDAAASAPLVEQVLQGLASPQCESYKVHDAKDLKPYGLDAPALTVTVVTRDGKEHRLLVGAPVDANSSSCYAKLAKGPAVFVINGGLASAADREALALLNPLLLRVGPGQLVKVQSKVGGAGLTLVRKDKDWQVEGAPAGAFPADTQTMAEVEAFWSHVRGQRFAAYGPQAALASYGLDKPEATVTVTVKGEGDKPEEHTVEVGKAPEGDKEARFARLDKGPGVVVLAPRAVRELERTYLDFVNRDVLKFKGSAVVELQRQAGADVLDVVQRDDGWHLVKPAAERADDKALPNLIAELSALRASKVAGYEPKNLKPFGLEPPAAVVTIKLNAEEKPAEYKLRIGKVVDEATGAAYAQVEGSKAVVVLPGRLTRQLLAGPLAYRDRGLVRFGDADVIRLERGPRQVTFAKVDGNWKMTEPLQAEVDQDELDELVNKAARLRADELVVENPQPADLKKYGLDRPEARWRFQDGEKEVLELLIGAKEKDGLRRYARVAGSRVLIFLLDGKLSERLLNEYRKRAVWNPPVDAAQVESLRYGVAGTPLVLEKKPDGDWQVLGKPEVKLNTATVNDTLAALAGLKLVRYVADKGADLKLYALNPPEVTLDVLTRSGKRTLLIGGPVGESKQRYAHLADSDRGDVFILSEADCARILRDAAALGKPPTSSAVPGVMGD